MSLWQKIRGTIETIFQIGLGGPNLKANGGAIEARNAGDSAFTVLRAAVPAGVDDVTTKTYVDTLASRTIVDTQFDGNNALPANTGTNHFYVVTTTGANAAIGQLLWDNGSGVGTVQVIAAVDGRMILTTQAFTGGTVVLKAESLYVWDATTSSWVNAGGSQQSGAVRLIRFAITNAATQDSATEIPANAIVVEAALDITTPYSGGANLTVGRASSTSLLMAAGDSLAQVAGIYSVEQDTPWGTAAVIRVTVTGAPAAGAGFVLVKYSLPDG